MWWSKTEAKFFSTSLPPCSFGSLLPALQDDLGQSPEQDGWAGYQQRRHDTCFPGGEVITNLLRRPDERHGLDHLRGDDCDGVLLVPGQVELLDLRGPVFE